MKGIKIEALPPHYQAQVRAKIASAPADNQSSVGDALAAEKETPRFDRPVNIFYHEKRKRLTDSDGQFTKYFTDAIVSCGILQDDDIKCIPQAPRKKQEKAKEDETTIIIEEV